MQQQMQQQFFRPGAPSVTGWQSMQRPGQTTGSANSSETVLVITDMQPKFPEANNERLQENICRLVDYAMARNWVIIKLEFVGYGDTLEPIRKRLEGYSRCYRVFKHGEDGSAEVLKLLKQLQVSAKHFVGCGVSVNVCVRLTMSGLAFSCGHPSTDVITSACGDRYAPRWDEYPEASHLRLLPDLSS